jgi:hypothetical protein
MMLLRHKSSYHSRPKQELVVLVERATTLANYDANYYDYYCVLFTLVV